MRLRNAFILVSISALIAGCGVLDQSDQVVITATPDAAERARAIAPLDATPALTTDTSAFENETTLLDGVCTEFLLGAAGDTFVWDTPEALAEFYDQVDESELCAGPVARGSFDFTAHILAGAITATTGCDAAYQVGEIVENAEGQTLLLDLHVEPGCDYELVEPLLVAVPRSPEGASLRVEVRGP